MSNTDFETLQTTKYGNVGERIVRELLDKKHYKYTQNTHPHHDFDFLVVDHIHKHVLAVDVKTKRPFLKYPHLQSCDANDFAKYLKIEHSYIIMVDVFNKKVYGQFVKILDRYHGTLLDGTKMGEFKVVTFPIDKFDFLKHLTDEEVEELLKHTKNV